MGVLKVCNPGGTKGDGKCIELSKKSLACPKDHYFRGIYQQDTTLDDGSLKKKGDPICQQETVCPPQSHYWKQENICHKCPRDSPVYKNNPNDPQGPRCEKCPKSKPFYLLNTKECVNRCYSFFGGIPFIDDICYCRHSGFPFVKTTAFGKQCRSCLPFHKYILSRNECKLDCPPGKPHFYGWKCNRCPSNRPVYRSPTCYTCPGQSNYNFNSNTCELNCPAGQTAVNHICQCPEETPHFYIVNGQRRCNKCRSGQVVSNGHCCPRDTPHHYGGQCNPCPSGQVVSNGHCCPSGQVGSNGHCCPPATPHYKAHTRQCYKCRSGIWFESLSRCMHCSYGLFERQANGQYQCKCGLPEMTKTLEMHKGQWTCRCPGNTWYSVYSNKCETCIGGRLGSSKIHCYCPSDRPRFSKGMCCPLLWHNSNGRCCPQLTENVNGVCLVRCDKNEIRSNGVCCRPGQVGYTAEAPTGHTQGGVAICCTPPTSPTWIETIPNNHMLVCR